MLIVAYSVSALAVPAFISFLDRAGLHRTNYQGRAIPLAGGLALILLFPFFLALAWLAGLETIAAAPGLIMAFALLGFGLAGLIDDCLGDAGDKGFRGHFRALFRQHRLTSGALKALFGGVIALLAALALASFRPETFGGWLQILFNTILLASAANLINLFDLRPGRAGKVFFLGLLIGAALAKEIDRYGGLVLLAAVSFLPLFRRDLRAEVMLGDTGANALGATLGMALAFWLTPHAKIAACLLLAALQLISERCSFSAVIDRFAFLRRLDHWGRERIE